MPFTVPVLCAVLLAAPHPATPRHETELDSLIASERAFAQTSVERGMKEAFLTHMAEDGVIFRPLPMKARPVWEARTAPTDTLIWEPCYAEVSGAGDLGVTMGPWELRPRADKAGQPVLHGHFISVWRKQKDGDWKVEFDLGTSHEKPSMCRVGSGELARGPIHDDPPTTDRTKQAVKAIQSAEKRFSAAARKAGLAAVIAGWTTEDLRLNREGRPPTISREGGREVLASDSTAVSWKPQSSGASRSGDLGYTYGIRERRRRGRAAAPDSSVYVNVWRRDRDGKWRVSLMVDNPLQ